MGNLEKFTSCRLINEEISYIDECWNGKFSDFVHSKIKEDLNNNNQNSQLMKDISLYVVIGGLGVVFFLFGMRSINVFEMLLSYGLGFFMLVFGIAGGILFALQSTNRK